MRRGDGFPHLHDVFSFAKKKLGVGESNATKPVVEQTKRDLGVSLTTIPDNLWKNQIISLKKSKATTGSNVEAGENIVGAVTSLRIEKGKALVIHLQDSPMKIKKFLVMEIYLTSENKYRLITSGGEYIFDPADNEKLEK